MNLVIAGHSDSESSGAFVSIDLYRYEIVRIHSERLQTNTMIGTIDFPEFIM